MMVPFTDMTGLAGCALALAAAVLALPGVARLPRNGRMLLAGTVAAAALLPLGGLPAAAYIRAVSGDLSISSLVLLALALQGRLSGTQTPDAGSRHILLVLLALASLWLYPQALGMGTFDPYRLGYADPGFLGGLLAVALAAWWRGLALPAAAIALAVLAWGAGWYESTNLWDYLLDPMAGIYALGALARRGMMTLLKR